MSAPLCVNCGLHPISGQSAFFCCDLCARVPTFLYFSFKNRGADPDHVLSLYVQPNEYQTLRKELDAFHARNP